MILVYSRDILCGLGFLTFSSLILFHYLLHCRGKKDSKPSAAPPPPAGSRRSSSQPSDADSKRSILEAVAKQTGGKLVEQAPPTEMVVSDALSDEEVERKSKTIVGELASNGDYKVCEA